MYGGTSVTDILSEMGNSSYNNTKKGKIQENLTNLLHAKKNCAKPDCAELREFIGKFIQHKMTRKNTPKAARFGEAKKFPSRTTANASKLPKLPLGPTNSGVTSNGSESISPNIPNTAAANAAKFNKNAKAPGFNNASVDAAENRLANPVGSKKNKNGRFYFNNPVRSVKNKGKSKRTRRNRR